MHGINGNEEFQLSLNALVAFERKLVSASNRG